MEIMEVISLPHEIFNIIIYYTDETDLLQLIEIIDYPKSDNDFKNLLYQNYPFTSLDPKLSYLNNYLVQAYSRSYVLNEERVGSSKLEPFVIISSYIKSFNKLLYVATMRNVHRDYIIKNGKLYLTRLNNKELFASVDYGYAVKLFEYPNAAVNMNRYAMINSKGELYIWGYNFGEYPKKIYGELPRIIKVILTSDSIFFLTETGDLYISGDLNHSDRPIKYEHINGIQDMCTGYLTEQVYLLRNSTIYMFLIDQVHELPKINNLNIIKITWVSHGELLMIDDNHKLYIYNGIGRRWDNPEIGETKVIELFKNFYASDIISTQKSTYIIGTKLIM